MTTGQRIVLILLALCVMAGMATGGKMYYRLAYLWGFLYFGGLIWSRLTLWRFYSNRSAHTLRVQVGQIFEERFEIQNLSWLPRIWIEVHDETQLPGSEGSRIITMINGKQARYYLARTRLVKRGVFPLGPTTLQALA